MATATLPPSCINSTTKNLTHHTFFPFEDDFSSSSISSTAADNNFSLFRATLGKRNKKSEDREIDIFTAEKYFSGSMDAGEAVAVMLPRRVWKSPPRAKEVNFPGDQSQNGEKSPPPAVGGKRFLGIFRCSCAGKNSVEVDRSVRGSVAGDLKNHSGAVMVVGNSTVGRGVFEEEEKATNASSSFDHSRVTVGIGDFEEVKNARINSSSLDVFGKEEFRSSLRRDLVFGKEEEFARNGDEDDVGSESSSDLFEIESFSTSTANTHRDSSGGGGRSAAAWYEPSEASIDWSVVTASAAVGNCSAAVDYGGGGGRWWSPPEKAAARRPGLLLGCGGDRAVRVVSSTGAGRRISLPPPPEKEAAERLQRVGLVESSAIFELAGAGHDPVVAARAIPRSFMTRSWE